MKNSKLWHRVRLHEIHRYHAASGIIDHCTCGHYWVESYD